MHLWLCVNIILTFYKTFLNEFSPNVLMASLTVSWSNPISTASSCADETGLAACAKDDADATVWSVDTKTYSISQYMVLISAILFKIKLWKNSKK